MWEDPQSSGLYVRGRDGHVFCPGQRVLLDGAPARLLCARTTPSWTGDSTAGSTSFSGHYRVEFEDGSRVDADAMNFTSIFAPGERVIVFGWECVVVRASDDFARYTVKCKIGDEWQAREVGAAEVGPQLACRHEPGVLPRGHVWVYLDADAQDGDEWQARGFASKLPRAPYEGPAPGLRVFAVNERYIETGAKSKRRTGSREQGMLGWNPFVEGALRFVTRDFNPAELGMRHTAALPLQAKTFVLLPYSWPWYEDTPGLVVTDRTRQNGMLFASLEAPPFTHGWVPEEICSPVTVTTCFHPKAEYEPLPIVGKVEYQFMEAPPGVRLLIYQTVEVWVENELEHFLRTCPDIPYDEMVEIVEEFVERSEDGEPMDFALCALVTIKGHIEPLGLYRLPL